MDDYAKSRGGTLSESEVILILKELKDAFVEMYSKNIIHRDVKPQNILIHNGKIKIADVIFNINFYFNNIRYFFNFNKD